MPSQEQSEESTGSAPSLRAWNLCLGIVGVPENYPSAWELSECPGIIQVPENYLSAWELIKYMGIIRVPGNYWSAWLIDFQFSAPWQ